MSLETEKRSRRRGRGSLQSYQTKAGERWRYQIRVPIDHEHPELGERKYSRGGFLTHDAADDEMQKAINKRRNQESFNKTPTLATYAQSWVAGLRLARSTIEGYKRLIRLHIVPELGDIHVDKLTATKIARHYRELEKHGRRDSIGYGNALSANTINKIHVVLGAILDAAIDDGLIQVNPSKKRRTINAPTGRDIRANKPEITTWSAAQLHAFLNWNRDVLQDDLHPLWRTMAFTGLRRSEALALKWNDINFKSERLSLRRAADVTQRDVTKPPKSGSARSIDLDSETVDVLKKYKAVRGLIALDLARPEAYIFANLEGRIRSPNEVGRRWSYRVRRAQDDLPGLPKITLHELRHTHATVLLELGEHPKVVQERLGHATIAITMDTYSHVSPTMQRTAIDRLARHISEA